MKIDFGATFSDLFTTEKAWPTFWLLTVCMLIPFIGPFVVTGYLFRRFARIRIGKDAEDFDFDHFVEHLMFGLWPGLAGLVVMVVALPVFILPLVPIFVWPTSGSENFVFLFGLIGIALIVALLLFLLIGLVSFPIYLRSGLQVNFAAGFSLSFGSNFLRKVGLPLLGWSTLLLILLQAAMAIGSLAFYVGVYPVMTFYSFSWTHLLFQNYDLYLERGGEPVEVAPDLIADFHRPPPVLPQKPPALPEG